MEPPVVYEETEIPPGMSCEDYRRERHPATVRTRRWLPRVVRRLRQRARRRRHV